MGPSLTRCRLSSVAVCRDVSVCPSIIGEGKQEVFPTACPVQRLVPNAEELRKGKIISCDCGGDADTQLLCNVRRPVRAQIKHANDEALPVAGSFREHVQHVNKAVSAALDPLPQMLPETRILINITQDGNGPLQKGHVKCVHNDTFSCWSCAAGDHESADNQCLQRFLRRPCTSRLYAGVPSADTDPVPSHLQYAFPGYWEAFFTGCAPTTTSPLYSPLLPDPRLFLSSFASRGSNQSAPRVRRRCSWSQRRCQDPLPRTSECLFLTVCSAQQLAWGKCCCATIFFELTNRRPVRCNSARTERCSVRQKVRNSHVSRTFPDYHLSERSVKKRMC